MIWHNEIDPFAAAWSRELMAAGLIPHGEVDTRSILDVRPVELAGYRQCHFFAGISVWPYALKIAGWPDDREVWTGSCPCQPFSAAGKGAGFADERHLWPLWFHQIDQCRPEFVFGEQVASKDGLAWLDLVQADLEGAGYTVGVLDTCAAGFGAPHIRQRLWWVGVADTNNARLEGQHGHGSHRGQPGRIGAQSAGSARLVGGAGIVEHPTGDGRQQRRPEPSGWGTAGGCSDSILADTAGEGWRSERTHSDATDRAEAVRAGEAQSGRRSAIDRPGPTNGFWRDADWLGCRDGKWRPVEPGSFPLAHGAAARVGFVCPTCLEASAARSDAKEMRALRDLALATYGCLPEEILLSEVSVGTSDQGAGDCRSGSVASAAPIPEHVLRELWGDGREPSAPHRQEPKEQCCVEYPHSLPKVPQSGAPACEKCGKYAGLPVNILGNRVGRLRGYGNAINAAQATEFIKVVMAEFGIRSALEDA